MTDIIAPPVTPVAQTLDWLLNEAKRRGVVPIEFRMEPAAIGALMGEIVDPWKSISNAPPTYKGLRIVETMPGTGMTIRTRTRLMR